MPDFSEPPWNEIALALRDLPLRDSAISILLIVVLAVVAMRLTRLFVHGIVKTLLDREASEGTAQELSAVELKKRMDTLDTFGLNAIRFFIVVIAALMILSTLQIDIGPAVAGLGIIGIAIGFGAQTLVRDYLNGALILVENQYAKGDVVRLAGVDGTVEDFTLRRTTLRDIDGVVHTIPNGEIRVASNLTRVWARINQDITLPYGIDVDRAIAVVDAVGKTMAADPAWKRRLLEAPRVDRVDALGEGGITLKILGTVRATEQWAAAGEFRKRLLAALESNGFQIPSAQRVGAPPGAAAGSAAWLAATPPARAGEPAADGDGDDPTART